MDIEALLQARRDQHPDAYYTLENPSEATDIGLTLRREEYRLWQLLLPDADDDLAVTLARLQRVTGRSEQSVLNSISAHTRIRELDHLRTLQEMSHRLDANRLNAIDQALMKLDLLEDPDSVAEIDRKLALYLIPTKVNQHFPTAGQIRRKINDWIRLLRPDLDLTKEDPRPPALDIRHGTDGRSYLDFDANTDVATELETLIKARQREKDLGPAEALLDLVQGNTHTSIVLNVYRAHDVENAPGFLFGPGWLSPEAAERLARRATKVRDMDKVATKVAKGYATPEDVRAYVVGRDGTCRYPGDSKRADKCQMDHTIDHADGGPTCGSNLCSLCQNHHNVKTDGRVRPIQVGNGEIVWLFDDGTWEYTEPDGPLAPKNRNWVQTVGQRIANRRNDNKAPKKED